jgi:hypothetical protein
MSESTDQPTQVLGEAGEPCRSCAAPLAADQRYCVNCGQRRGEPRVDFRAHLSPAATGAAPVDAGTLPGEPNAAAEPRAADSGPRRDYTPLAAVGGIAVLGLMLLIGVLIGKGNSASTAPTPTQVIVPAAGGEAGKTASSEETGKGKAEAKPAKSKGAKRASNGSDLASGKGGSGPVEASDQALQELQEQSPDEYSKSSAKLPDEIATGGAPPPTDDKAPGGGSKGTAIE